jgi:hypothetical protein
MNDQLQELAEEFDIELEEEDPQEFTEQTVDGVEMEAREATVIKPFSAGNGYVKDENYNYVLEGGDQLSLTVKHRPECPSCSHVLAESDEPNQLSGECSVCGEQTCHRNQSKCESCGKLFCPEHASGHGLKDNPYCDECRGDVEEDLGFERGMEERKQEHSEEMEKLEKELKEEKQRKELELKQVRQEREQIRKDWSTVLQVLETAGALEDEDQEEEDTGPGGLTGGGSLTGGGKPVDENDEDEESEDGTPDWFDDQFNSNTEDN